MKARPAMPTGRASRRSRARAYPAATAAAVAALIAAAPAAASTVLHLDPAELVAGSERVVTARVDAVASRWAADGATLETVVTLVADDGDTLTVVQPGGEVGGVREIVVGMPTYRVGERARFHLRHNRDGVTWRVYGWDQGKWPERIVDGVARYLPGPSGEAGGEAGDGLTYFATNGMVWPASVMPVPYLLNDAGSDDLTPTEVADAVAAAFATWQAVPCSSLTYRFDGTTSLGVTTDGQNVILFVESGWVYGREAAGATALWIVDGQQTADVAMNGENYTWAIGPPGALAASGTFDLQAVLTHELGHFSGLGHTTSSHDTMYYSWTPWAGQRTPSRDDKQGLCSIYPVTADECSDAGQCGAGETCEPTAAGRLCDVPADPIGASCNYDRVECEDFCLFTAGDLSSGYCSRFCETNADCPLTHHCATASAGSMPVKVCFAGAQPQPDAGPGACAVDDGCPAGQYCSTMSACTFDCRVDDDCGAGATCDPRGRCQPGGDAGCGCRTGGTESIPGGAAPGLLVAAGLLGRRRRRRR